MIHWGILTKDYIEIRVNIKSSITQRRMNMVNWQKYEGYREVTAQPANTAEKLGIEVINEEKARDF